MKMFLLLSGLSIDTRAKSIPLYAVWTCNSSAAKLLACWVRMDLESLS